MPHKAQPLSQPAGNIMVHTGKHGHVVYGRFGAVIHADINKVVTYSNIVETCDEYQRMINKLK